MTNLDILYQPVDFGPRSELRDMGFAEFYADWKVKNEYEKLSASPADIEMGAMLEFAYQTRGALDDPRKYADVKFGEGFGEFSNKAVDCKASLTRAYRQAAINHCIATDKKKCDASYFKQLGIYQIHRWLADKGTTILKPCYKMNVYDQSVVMF